MNESLTPKNTLLLKKKQWVSVYRLHTLLTVTWEQGKNPPQSLLVVSIWICKKLV